MARRLLAVSVGWIGISLVADAVPSVLLPYRVASDGGDATAVGLISLVGVLLAAGLQPAAGALSDRTGRAPVAIAGVALAASGLGLFLVPGAAIVGAFLALAGVSVAQAAQQALLPDRVPAETRGTAGGLKGFFDVGGAFVGFAMLAGLMAAGRVDLAVVGMALGLAAAVCGGLLMLRGQRSGMHEASPAPTPRASLTRLVVARFAFLFGIYGVGRFLLLFVADRAGLSSEAAAAAASVLFAVIALATAVASLPSGWLADRIGRRGPMAAGGVVAAMGIGLLATATSVEAMLLPGALMALGTALFGAASWAALSDAVPAPEAGRLLGIANLGTAAAAAAAGLLGPLVDAAGFGPAFAAAALATVVGGSIPLIGVGRIRIGTARVVAG